MMKYDEKIRDVTVIVTWDQSHSASESGELITGKKSLTQHLQHIRACIAAHCRLHSGCKALVGTHPEPNMPKQPQESLKWRTESTPVASCGILWGVLDTMRSCWARRLWVSALAYDAWRPRNQRAIVTTAQSRDVLVAHDTEDMSLSTTGMLWWYLFVILT
jgi:hypothetical protein